MNHWHHPARVRRAIRLIEESRTSHVNAIVNIATSVVTLDFLEGNGDILFHNKCIREYDYVLKVLRACLEAQ